MTTPLIMWVIYDHPADRPDRVVARKWECTTVSHATAEIIEGKTLDEVRAALPPGLVCLHRCDGDDPKIVEVWL